MYKTHKYYDFANVHVSSDCLFFKKVTIARKQYTRSKDLKKHNYVVCCGKYVRHSVIVLVKSFRRPLWCYSYTEF